jgi:hypothetical protein
MFPKLILFNINYIILFSKILNLFDFNLEFPKFQKFSVFSARAEISSFPKA